MSAPATSLGIVFDIDGLADTFYGFAAYRLLFKTIFAANQRPLQNCRLSDGDTTATLAGSARDYVIAIETPDHALLDEIRREIANVVSPALKAPQERFLLGDAIAKEPLVPAARINDLGRMDWCETSFVYNAWDVERAAIQKPSAQPRDTSGKQRTPD